MRELVALSRTLGRMSLPPSPSDFEIAVDAETIDGGDGSLKVSCGTGEAVRTWLCLTLTESSEVEKIELGRYRSFSLYKVSSTESIFVSILSSLPTTQSFLTGLGLGFGGTDFQAQVRGSLQKKAARPWVQCWKHVSLGGESDDLGVGHFEFLEESTGELAGFAFLFLFFFGFLGFCVTAATGYGIAGCVSSRLAVAMAATGTDCTF